jgi:glutamate-ammonia-ligase adenylyltransferase
MQPLMSVAVISEALRLEHARACSPFLATLLDRHPGWLQGFEESGRLDAISPPQHDTLARLIETLGLDSALRRFRNQEMLRIVWRDLNGLAELNETMTSLTRLAEVCLDAALAYHTEALQKRFGIPRNSQGAEQGLVVLGMGKLGGGELNLSSDIDIILCFPENGECDGPRATANAQFFTRLSQAVIRSLSEITADGFCFRVDTRLRPFGESGPLCCSFEAMEQYYQREGRDWERYALVKARIVAGDREAGEELVGLLKPFVYRRYIDYGAVEGLHEMRASVQQDAARREMQDDVKRGPGGIREIEFLIQGFQLLRGGREPGLQTPSLLTALQQLHASGLLKDGVADEILSDYRFLRDVENRIQAQQDQQTHSLPDGEGLQRLVCAMQLPDSGTLKRQLEEVRRRVRENFDLCFPAEPDATPAGNWAATWQHLRHEKEASDAALSLLRQKPLADFMDRVKRLALSQRAARRLDRFMPLLFSQIASRQPQDKVLDAVLDLVLAISRRSAYLSLLLQNPPALDRMLDLFGASDWIATVVIRFPSLLDELIDPSLGRSLPTADEITRTVNRTLQTRADPETALLSLNHVKRAFQLRIAVAELETTLDARAVQLALTQLAEALLQGVLILSKSELLRRHGDLPDSPLAIIGYGTLGAAELGYSSDLDLVFLYRATNTSSDGAKPLPPEQYHTRLARRVLSLLTAPTASGRLYETDMRLRPNGRSGLLVSSLSAFSTYQSDSAWTWEWQALTRGRWVAGDADVGEEFQAIRQKVLCQPRDDDAIRTDIHEMRTRMRVETGYGGSSGAAPFKHHPGGLVDIEFIAQFGVLSCAARHPAVTQATGTIGQLHALGGAGFLPQQDVHTLDRVHAALTRGRHLARIQRNAPGMTASDLQETATAAAIFERVFALSDAQTGSA